MYGRATTIQTKIYVEHDAANGTVRGLREASAPSSHRKKLIDVRFTMALVCMCLGWGEAQIGIDAAKNVSHKENIEGKSVALYKAILTAAYSSDGCEHQPRLRLL
jgi:hypothetical protein